VAVAFELKPDMYEGAVTGIQLVVRDMYHTRRSVPVSSEPGPESSGDGNREIDAGVVSTSGEPVRGDFAF
jgi:hypothetical protein